MLLVYSSATLHTQNAFPQTHLLSLHPRRLHPMPKSVVVHASQESPTRPHPSTKIEHEAIQFAIKRQKIEEFASIYCHGQA
jgi:hypothetical protein